MDLKDFVSETLVSIISGVADAQEKSKELGANVNPSGLMRNTSNVASNAVWDNSNNNYAQSVNFDIAVTAEDTAKAGAKVKVITGIFGANANAESGNKNSLASRVQFTVPILLPPQDIKKPSASKSTVGSTRLNGP
jgi:hypothetical protein